MDSERMGLGRRRWRRRALMVPLAVIAAGLAGGGWALANVSSIHACANNHSGALRVAAHCRANEHAITWARQGPAGPAGATGPQGQQGPQGPAGLQGPQGIGSNALAGAQVSPDGAIGSSDWFNTYGGEPTVTNPSTGLFYVTFPGAPFGGYNGDNVVIGATPDTPSGECTALNSALGVTNAQGVTSIAVQTYDCSGAAADRGFYLVVFGDQTLG
jgi:hypothetical protein